MWRKRMNKIIVCDWMKEGIVWVWEWIQPANESKKINNKTWNQNKTAHKNLSMYDDTALSLHDIWLEFGTWTRRWFYERKKKKREREQKRCKDLKEEPILLAICD